MAKKILVLSVYVKLLKPPTTSKMETDSVTESNITNLVRSTERNASGNGKVKPGLFCVNCIIYIGVS